MSDGMVKELLALAADHDPFVVALYKDCSAFLSKFLDDNTRDTPKKISDIILSNIGIWAAWNILGRCPKSAADIRFCQAFTAVLLKHTEGALDAAGSLVDASMSQEMGALLVQVAAHECGGLQSLWGRALNDVSQVALFLDIVIGLLHIVERFSCLRGRSARNEFMGPVYDTVRKCFVNQAHFGATIEQRANYFASMVSQRVY